MFNLQCMFMEKQLWFLYQILTFSVEKFSPPIWLSRQESTIQIRNNFLRGQHLVKSDTVHKIRSYFTMKVNCKLIPRLLWIIWISNSPVNWSCRIHRLHLYKGKRPSLMRVLDMTLNNLMLRLKSWTFEEGDILLHCN